jgi:hypothetical protein
MIFALTDKTFTIDVPHINAGMAWIRYWTDSVKFIFQSALEEVKTEQVNKTAAELMAFLKLQGKASRTEISTVCFRGHTSKDKLDAAIDELLTTSPPQIEVETVARVKGESGPPTKYYKLVANYANCANNEHSCGLQPDLPPLRTVRTDHHDFANFADYAAPPNQPQSRVGIDVSQTSHNSQHGLGNPDADLEDAEVF